MFVIHIVHHTDCYKRAATEAEVVAYTDSEEHALQRCIDFNLKRVKRDLDDCIEYWHEKRTSTGFSQLDDALQAPESRRKDLVDRILDEIVADSAGSLVKLRRVSNLMIRCFVDQSGEFTLSPTYTVARVTYTPALAPPGEAMAWETEAHSTNFFWRCKKDGAG